MEVEVLEHLSLKLKPLKRFKTFPLPCFHSTAAVCQPLKWSECS